MIGIYLDPLQNVQDYYRGRKYEKLSPLNCGLISAATGLKKENEKVVAVMPGSEGDSYLMREALARGCDRAVLFQQTPAMSDAWAATAVFKELGCELIITGERVLDGGVSYAGAQIAGLLRIPQISRAKTLMRDPAGDRVLAQCSSNGGIKTLALRFPGLITMVVGAEEAPPLTYSLISAAFNRELTYLPSEAVPQMAGFAYDPDFQICGFSAAVSARRQEMVSCIAYEENDKIVTPEAAVRVLFERLRMQGLLQRGGDL